MKITKIQLKRIIREAAEDFKPRFKGDTPAKQGSVSRGTSVEPKVNMDFQRNDPGEKYSGDIQDVAAAQEKIEEILNALYDNGVENDGLKALLNNILDDIDAGFVGEPT